MRFFIKTKWIAWLGIIIASVFISGCTSTGKRIPSSSRLTERACLERAMFFEANRSSRDGLIAVGTVVMNRVNSSHYPKTICGVVGQKNQFAPGVLTRPMNSKALPDVRAAADAVLRGERHPKLKNAMFFHTAGMTFPYKNMHYTLVAGGNAFYEKRGRDGKLQLRNNDQPYNVAFAYRQERGHKAPMPAPVRTKAPLPTNTPAQDKAPEVDTIMVASTPVSKAAPEADPKKVMLGYAATQPDERDEIGALLAAEQKDNEM